MKRNLIKYIPSIVFSLLIIWGIHWLSFFPLKNEGSHSLLRVAIRYQENKIATCRDYTEDELRLIPIHMRQPRLCSVVYVPYQLSVWVDGSKKIGTELSAGGQQSDRPLVMIKDFLVDSGNHEIEVLFEPAASIKKNETLRSFRLNETINFNKNEIGLLKFDPVKSNLTLTSS